MAKMNDTALQNAMPTLTMQAIDPKAAGNHNDLYYYRNNAEAIQTLLGSSSQTTNMPPAVAKLQSQLESSSAGILDSFEGSLTSAANPLAAIHSFGEDLLITGQVLYVAFVVIFFIAILLGGIDPMVLGTGTPRPFWNAVIIFLSNALFPVLIFFIGFCFSFGGMLAFYIPMIPYIVFLVGALGWMLSVIEAVFAAPFVALGILSPGGQHDLLGKSEPAMFMLFNIFMRPSLMIVGMSAAMVVAPVAIKLVNLTFSTAMGTIISNPGPIELIFIIVVYTFIIITVINKVFTLIHVIPERVITWVGGQAAPGGGEAEALQTVKGGAEGAAGRIGGGATGGAETIMAGAAAHKAMQPEKGAATVGDAGGKRSAAGAKVAPKDVAINEFQQKKIDAAEKKKEVDEKAAGKGTEIEMMKPTKPKDKDKP
jgi:conjugal transfer/type IV secretion protein DotA/TraY